MQHLAIVDTAHRLVGIARIERSKRDARWCLNEITVFVSQMPADVELWQVGGVVKVTAESGVHVVKVVAGCQIQLCRQLAIVLALHRHARRQVG